MEARFVPSFQADAVPSGGGEGLRRAARWAALWAGGLSVLPRFHQPAAWAEQDSTAVHPASQWQPDCSVLPLKERNRWAYWCSTALISLFFLFISQISEAVLASGEHCSRKFRVQNQSPLMYEWYQEQYVGAAHGLSGIYYFLMQVGHVSSSFRLHLSLWIKLIYLESKQKSWSQIAFKKRLVLVRWKIEK